MKRHQCAALDDKGRRCRRRAVRRVRYHGDGELYGYFMTGWVSWVAVWLCDRHSEPAREEGP